MSRYVQLTVTVPPKLARCVEERAAGLGITKSAVVEAALRADRKRHEEEWLREFAKDLRDGGARKE